MYIKLISPKMTLRPMDSEFKRVLSPSLSLLVVAALTPREHTVELADENTSRLCYDDHPDLVGINVNVDTSTRAYEIAQQYRHRGVPVVLGGIHTSANPQEGLRFADAICIGEAESVWETLLKDTQRNQLQTHYQATGPTDLSLTPLPRRDLIPTHRYLYTNIVSSGRGCPFRCDFCYNSNDYVHGHRNRPIGQVLEEILALDTKQVMFIDDNFIGNIAWTHRLLEAMRPLDLTWHAAVSANLVHHLDLLDQMADTGCRSLFIGFESINESSIRGVHKVQNRVAEYEALIREVHKRNIMVNASLVFGLDEDREDVFDNTLAWLIRNRVETMTAHILTPYPGTRLFARFQAEGRITDLDWRHYNTSEVVFQPKYMSATQLRQGYLKLYRDFYSMKNILKRMPAGHQTRLPYLLFNLGYRKYGKIAALLANQLGLMSLYGRLARHLSYGI